MAKFINQNEALEYQESISDPIIAAMLERGYRTVLWHMGDFRADADFDVLYFLKLLEAFFKGNEQRISQELLGQFGSDEDVDFSKFD